MLTGKTAIMFEEWYNKVRRKEQLIGKTEGKPKSEYGWIETPPLMGFYICPFSMQQGVLLEFFREQGISISIDECEGTVIIKARYTGNRYCGLLFQIKNPDYNTALTEAIRKANELVNGGVK